MLANVYFFLNNAQESFKDTLKEVHKLNKCPSLQDSVKYAIDDDCTMMKCAVGSSSQIIFKPKIRNMHAYLCCFMFSVSSLHSRGRHYQGSKYCIGMWDQFLHVVYMFIFDLISCLTALGTSG